MAERNDPRTLKLAQALADVLPGDQLRRNSEVLAQRLAERLDLVTREEFDVQRKVLLRTRKKVQELERQLAELEAKQ